ncbi:MAG: hypothetical protein IKT27_06965 [Clostridia bacterium]|nr:hypothetical protein [Clostridia bacterium]
MINVKFDVINLKQQIAIIKNFLSSKNQTSIYIANEFEIDINLPTKSKNKMVEEKITKLYNQELQHMQSQVLKFQDIWDKNASFINQELTKIFGKEYSFECKAYVNLNPVFPRYLQTKSFDVNLYAREDIILLSSVHEIVHFVWFELWQKNFPDIKIEDYEFPNLSWIISEVAIEPIFRFSALKDLSPDLPAYDYFYTDKIDNKPIAEIANNIYQESKDINEFQNNMYQFFKIKDWHKLIK